MRPRPSSGTMWGTRIPAIGVWLVIILLRTGAGFS
jgi:hypothetical protein